MCLCAVSSAPASGEVPGKLKGSDPDRKWYAEPTRVFDDLFFLGQTAFSGWGCTPEGIDPAQIRQVIISHAHGDLAGGAGILPRRGAAK